MRIAECFLDGRPVFSFEFFPPKSPEATERLYRTVARLARLEPSFVSVTYGAGGSTRRLTVELVARIKEEIGVEAMAHLTCVGHRAEEIAAILADLRGHRIENVLALRGDPPQGATEFVRPEGGFSHALELVAFIRSRFDFCVGAAAYPEGHVEAPDRETDLRRLKEKVDAGVDFLITQLFFDPADYFRFVADARSLGIRVPILPGIIPVTNVAQIERFTRMCGARIPTELQERLDRVRDDDEAVVREGIAWATAQSRALLEGGAPGIHFYTLNRSRSSRAVYQNLTGRAAR